MGWERRKGTAEVYYTRTERVGKVRRRVYLGRGPAAEIAWLTDVLARVDKEVARGRAAAGGRRGP